MSRSFSIRLTALIAVFALSLATGAWLLHGHDPDGGQQTELRCDLCLQFAGTAGALPATVSLVTPASLLFLTDPATDAAVPPPSRARAHRARAPPRAS